MCWEHHFWGACRLDDEQEVRQAQLWCLTTLNVCVHLPGVLPPAVAHFIWHWNVEKESFICPTEEKLLGNDFTLCLLQSCRICSHWGSGVRASKLPLHAQHLGIWYLAQGYLGLCSKNIPALSSEPPPFQFKCSTGTWTKNPPTPIPGLHKLLYCCHFSRPLRSNISMI